MRTLLTTALAVSLFASAGAAGANPGNGKGHGPDKGDNHGKAQTNQPGGNQHGNVVNHPKAQWERQAQKRYAAGRYRTPPGYYVRQWAHGDHLPAGYRTRDYLVDYRQYGLPAPPPGYQYVRVGDDAYLSGANTGIVQTVIRALFQ